METKKAVRDWETAYRRYLAASDLVASVRDANPAALREMADASHAVAVAWRRITVGGDLPWWSLAAALSAAEAFEQQSQDWQRRVEGNDTQRELATGAGRGGGDGGAWFGDWPGGVRGPQQPGPDASYGPGGVDPVRTVPSPTERRR